MLAMTSWLRFRFLMLGLTHIVRIEIASNLMQFLAIALNFIVYHVSIDSKLLVYQLNTSFSQIDNGI